MVMRSLAVTLFLFISTTALASQPLETETARPLPQGIFKVELTGEFQRSNEGTEQAFPLVFEYGLTSRTELTVEPVFGASIRPKHGLKASGPGDTEITLTHLFASETPSTPAFAVAGEIKLPTAKNRLIGTGKTDFNVTGIVSKRVDHLDIHGNLGYTVVGRPSGTRLNNTINYAVAGEFHVSTTVDVVAEVIGNTSSTGENGSEGAPSTGPIPAEAAGAERSVMLGMRYHLSPALFFSVGASYDNNHAFLIRPGVTYRFGAR